MPSAFSEQLIAQAGPVDGYLHIDPQPVEDATKLDKAFGAVNRYEPWTHKQTEDLLKYHPVAVWRNLSVTIASREGSFGRMITFYGGWSSAGAAPPKTVHDMAALKSCVIRTFGGTGDPGMFNQVVPCPFDGVMTDTLNTPYNAGVRAVFYYAFTEVELTDKAPKSMRALLLFRGHYDVYGRY
jgi:ABC-type uncharacterized transport system permease subunit